jgi:hypothetical protein
MARTLVERKMPPLMPTIANESSATGLVATHLCALPQTVPRCPMSNGLTSCDHHTLWRRCATLPCTGRQLLHFRRFSTKPLRMLCGRVKVR